MNTVCTLAIVFTSCSSGWIQPITPVLPRQTRSFAIGVYEDTITMIGGTPSNTNAKQLFQYDTRNNAFIDNGTSALSQDIWNEGSFYTQSKNILYIMHYNNPAIHTYNLQSNEFVTNVANSLNPPMYVGQCLASTKDHLFITGGRYLNQNQYLNDVQMMNISTKTWIWISNMNDKRYVHSCTIDPITNILYVISGVDYTNNNNIIYHKSIERIEINNINQQSWTYYGNLNTDSLHGRSVYYNRKIFVVAGWSSSIFYYTNIMHIINTTETPSISPTKYPTITPTINPSDSTTKNPSGIPTKFTSAN
eukprot:466107_1